MNKINIWGSCVTRDAVEFGHGVSIGIYCARQSVVSSVAEPVSDATFQKLTFKEGANPFHRRVVEENFLKTSLIPLCEKHPHGALILDLIGEKAPIGITYCGTQVTFSQAASKFSNAESLIIRKIPSFSDEHVELFGNAIKKLAVKLSDRPVVIHKAFYAEGKWEFKHANQVLRTYYDMAISSLHVTSVIEVEQCLRASSPQHKWGLAPYHYVDGYYQDFIEKLATGTGMPLSVKPGFTMQKNSS